MKLRLRLIKQVDEDETFTLIEISRELGPEISQVLYQEIIDEVDYIRLKPFEGILYTADSQALLKNWIQHNGGKRR